MIAEVIAALVVGVLALGFVLEPLVRGTRRNSAAAELEPLDAEATPRGIALAALREIEFDRETGKLSDDDYQMLTTKYTGEAIAAMRAEEQARPILPGATPAGPDAVEAVIAAKVRALRSARSSQASDGPSCPSCGPRPEPDALFCSSCGNRLPTGASCGGCGAAVPPDGKFCEACGSKVAA